MVDTLVRSSECGESLFSDDLASRNCKGDYSSPYMESPKVCTIPLQRRQRSCMGSMGTRMSRLLLLMRRETMWGLQDIIRL
ncbi:hypothetical protein Hanom_Chr04g00361371 [Helianthus anomalus]